MSGFDVDGARKAGYSDAEIADHLGQQSQFDVAGARKAGYSNEEIVSHLVGGDQPKTNGLGSDVQNFAAGMGEEAYRPVLGLKQMNAGVADAGEKFSTSKSDFARSKAVEQEIADNAELSAPLNATKAGKTGRVAGVGAEMLGAAMVPGANGAIGSSIVGGLTGALQPTAPGESRGNNALLGAGAGLVGQQGGKYVGEAITSKLAQAKAAAAVANASAPVTPVSKASDAGYILSPSQAKPGLLNKLLEGYGGKIQTAQAASLKNQPNTNRLAKAALGIADDQPLSVAKLDEVRAKAGKAYQAVKEQAGTLQATTRYSEAVQNLGAEYRSLQKAFPNTAKNPDIDGLIKDLNKPQISAEDAVNMVKLLRKKATVNIKAWQDDAKQSLGLAQRKAADALDGLIEDNLRQSGRRDLFVAYRDARQVIAKSHDVEVALNDASGDVDAKKLGEMLKKRPLTGELRTIASFGKTFPKNAQMPEKIGGQPGFSPLDTAAAAATAIVSPHQTLTRLGEVAGLIAGRPLARAVATSRRYQTSMVAPQEAKVPLRLMLSDKAMAGRRAVPASLSEMVVRQNSEEQ